MSEQIIEADHYIDDTVQLEHIAAELEAEMEDDEFGPHDDRVMIIPGQGGHEITDSTIEVAAANRTVPDKVPSRYRAVVAVLTLINLLNYMDRFTVAGE